MKKLLLILMTLLIACSIVSCGSIPGDTGNSGGNDGFNTGKVTLTSAYSKARDLGFEGTLEEFIKMISGEDGKDGTDGKDGQDGKDGTDGKGSGCSSVSGQAYRAVSFHSA